MTTACVDAPVRPEHLQADGQLQVHARGLEQSAFAAPTRPTPRQAVNITAVLAPQAKGALEDAQVFPADVGAVHLHLRADSLPMPRQVTYRWTHEDVGIEVPGVLAPTTTLSLAASYAIDPSQLGKWRVEVLEGGEGVTDPKVLFERDFEVVRPSS